MNNHETHKAREIVVAALAEAQKAYHKQVTALSKILEIIDGPVKED